MIYGHIGQPTLDENGFSSYDVWVWLIPSDSYESYGMRWDRNGRFEMTWRFFETGRYSNKPPLFHYIEFESISLYIKSNISR